MGWSNLVDDIRNWFSHSIEVVGFCQISVLT